MILYPNHAIASPLVLIVLLGIVSCDHLRQSNDEVTEPSATSGDSKHQLADPEYIKRELKDIIAMKVDADKDKYASYEELKNYLANLHEKNIEYNLDKQWAAYQPQIHEVFSWEGYEPEKKEVLTWDHYFNQTYPELVNVDIGLPLTRQQDTSGILDPVEAEKKEALRKKPQDNGQPLDPHLESLKQMVYRADERWKLADENGDTLLTKPEFKFLLYPDEGHEELQKLFVREATEDMDLNKDGKICLDEFMKHLQVLASDQERHDPAWLSSQQENFGRFLDKNKDGVLESDEIKNWLVPSKSKKFGAEAKRLMDIGDSNEDHKLSMTEILEHYDQYITLLPADYWSSVSDDITDPMATQDDSVDTIDVDHDEL